MTPSDISLRGVRRDTKRFTREARQLVTEIHEQLLKDEPKYAKGWEDSAIIPDEMLDAISQVIVSLAFLLNTSPKELSARPKSLENKSQNILWGYLRRYSMLYRATRYEREFARVITQAFLDKLNITSDEARFLIRLNAYRSIPDLDPFAVEDS